MKKLTIFSITALTAFAMTGAPSMTSMAAVFGTGCSPASGKIYNGSNGSYNMFSGRNSGGSCQNNTLSGGSCQDGGFSGGNCLTGRDNQTAVRTSGSVQIFGGVNDNSGILGNGQNSSNCQTTPCQGSICGDTSCTGDGIFGNQILPILPLDPEDWDQDMEQPGGSQNQPGGSQNQPGGSQNQPGGNQNQPGGETDKPDSNPDQADSFEEQVLALVNEERAKSGAAPLTMDNQALIAADVRAREIQSSFSHTRPDGSNYSTALSQAGVSFRASGENIAYGQTSAEEVMRVWMNSSGHRANILNSNYTSIGVGHVRSAQGVDYWTQLFFN